MGFYQAYPENPQADGTFKASKKNRLELITEKGKEPYYEAPSRLNHLVIVLRHLGYAKYGFEGMSPLSWSEIKAYSDVAEEPLTWWESSVVRRMSSAYINGYHRGKNINAIFPSMEDYD